MSRAKIAVTVDGQALEVIEEAADDTPFGTLLHFRKDHAGPHPRVLLVAPMSGHFATLLRNTVQVMLPEHDVYITDWKNARDVPLSEGRFGLDEFVDHIIRFLGVMGQGAHVVAVCQPAVPALAAAAVMAEAGDAAVPRSMTLMAGPIDTRVNPTGVNELAQSRSIEWFQRHLIGAVPWRFPGAFRHVYPGFVQLAAFMSMNLDRHINAHLGQFRSLVGGDLLSAEAHRRFYGEYGAVMDKGFLEKSGNVAVILYDLESGGEERKLGDSFVPARLHMEAGSGAVALKDVIEIAPHRTWEVADA